MPASIKHLRQMVAKGDKTMMLFALWEADGLYYQVNLIKLDDKNFKAIVRYEDGTEVKVKNTNLHIQFNTNDLPYQSEDEIVCCICEGGESEDPNNLILCDVCQQGYHQECHKPAVTAKDLECEWTCCTCDYMLKQLVPKMMSSTPKIRPKKFKKPSPLRVALKPIKAPRKKPDLPNGATIDGAVPEVIEVAKALVQTEEFMKNLNEVEQEEEKAPEEERVDEQEQEQVIEPEVIQDKKKKKTTKVTKAKKIPQPA